MDKLGYVVACGIRYRAEIRQLSSAFSLYEKRASVSANIRYVSIEIKYVYAVVSATVKPERQFQVADRLNLLFYADRSDTRPAVSLLFSFYLLDSRENPLYISLLSAHGNLTTAE